MSSPRLSCQHTAEYDPHCLACALPDGAVDVDVIRDGYNIPARVFFDLDDDALVIDHAVEGWTEPAPLSR